jgi:periplasmic protein TonB
VRLDSPAVLATCGTLAIHLLLAIAGDAIVVLNPARRYEPPPVVELFDIEPPELKPPPPPIEDKQEQKVEPTKPVEQPVVREKVQRRAPPPPADQPPPPQTDPDPNPSGGAPVAQMENIAPSATGVAVAQGKPTDRVGRGGTGTGTGAGSGAGSSDAPPKPVSVATIKSRAMPRGDFSYFDASKDYPAEAKALGIEGVIRVRLIVDELGKVKSSVLLNRLGHGLDELALKRAAQIEFEPARDTDDKPVSSVVVWTFNMTLPK